MLGRLLDRLESPEYRQRYEEFKAAERRRKAELVAVEKAEHRANVWRRRGLRYQQCTLDNYEVTNDRQGQVMAKLRAYAASIVEQVSSGTNVVLVGPTGTGKDHLLAGLVHVALDAGLSVHWEAGSSLWLALREAIKSQTEAEMVAQLTRPDVLVLSDPVPPHVEPTNYERSILYAVVDQRYSSLRPIWVSINAAGRHDAEQRLGAAVADRLRDRALSLACDWPSYRRPRCLDGS